MRTSVLAQDFFCVVWFCLDRDSGDLLPWLVGAALTAPFHRRFLHSMEPMTVHGEMGWKGLKAGKERIETVVLSILFGEPRLVKIASYVNAKPMVCVVFVV